MNNETYNKKEIIKLLSLLFFLIYIFTTPSIKIYASNNNSTQIKNNYADSLPLPKLTGDYQKDLIAVAKSQLGYKESETGETIYSAWAGQNGKAWCSEFVAWCANKAKIPTSIIPVGKSSNQYRDFFSKRGKFYIVSNGQDNNLCGCEQYASGIISISEILPGDILVVESNNNYSDGADHTCIALSISGNKVNTIDGNSNNMVRYSSSNPKRIHGVCRPYYHINDHKHTGGTATCKEKAICSICGMEYGSYGEHKWRYSENGNDKHLKYCIYGDAKSTNESCTYKNGKCTKCRAVKSLSAPKIKSVSPAGYRTIKIIWSKVPNASSYAVYYRKPNDIMWWRVAYNIKGTSYTHVSSKESPLNLGQKYKYMVMAVHNNTYSKYSNESAAIAPRIPKPTINLKKTSNGIQIAWKKVQGATTYQVQRYQNGKWVTLGTTKNVTFVDKKAKSKGTYQYRVRSCRGNYYSSWSGTKSIRR